MSRLRARLATTLAALALAACVSGCEVEGTVDVLSEQSLAVDVTLTGLYRGACSSLTSGLSDVEVRRGRDPGGQRFCRVSGTLDPSELRGLDLVPAGEYYVLTVELDGTPTSWPLSDVTVRFPGQVVEASHGTASGRSVRLTDLSDLASGERLRLVALRRAGPPGWVVAAGLGLVGGAAATFGVQRWLAARRRRPAPGDDALAAAGSEPVGPVGEPVEPEPAFDPEFFAPDRSGVLGEAAAAAEPVVWAQPPPPAEPVSEPRRARTPADRDHSEWGPPPGDRAPGEGPDG